MHHLAVGVAQNTESGVSESLRGSTRVRPPGRPSGSFHTSHWSLSGPYSALSVNSQGVLGKQRNWRCWLIVTLPRGRIALPAGDLLQIIRSCTPAAPHASRHAPRSAAVPHMRCRDAKCGQLRRSHLADVQKPIGRMCHRRTHREK